MKHTDTIITGGICGSESNTGCTAIKMCLANYNAS